MPQNARINRRSVIGKMIARLCHNLPCFHVPEARSRKPTAIKWPRAAVKKVLQAVGASYSSGAQKMLQRVEFEGLVIAFAAK